MYYAVTCSYTQINTDIRVEFNVWYFIHCLLRVPFLVLLIRNVQNFPYRWTGNQTDSSSSGGGSWLFGWFWGL